MTTDNNKPADNTETNNTGDQAAADTAAANTATPPKARTLREATETLNITYGIRESYVLLKPRYDEMPADKVPPVTLDVGKVIVLGIGVLPEVEKLKPDILDQCPRLPENLIEQVRQGLFGLTHANTLRQLATAGSTSEAMNGPVAALRVVRDHLVGDVNPLVVRGIVSPQAIVLSPGNNPRNVAFDVLRLVEVSDANYHHLDGQSKMTRTDLQAAATAAQDLLQYLGAKEQSTESAEDATLTRQRALAYFIALYEELRWAVRFVRRNHKDAHLIMPSLFTLRKKRGGAAAENADEADDAAAPVAPQAPAANTDAATGVDLAHLQALMGGGNQAATPATSATTAATATSTSGSGNTPGGTGTR